MKRLSWSWFQKDQRDDAGDPGLLGPSRGQGPHNSLAKSEPCLEAMAGLWRTFEAQYEDDRTASLSTETARWSPAHEHQFLLFRSGCRADPGHSSLKSMSRHKQKGLGARDPSHAATVAAKPINLMTNFLTARTDVVADLDRRASKDSSKTNADRENFVDAARAGAGMSSWRGSTHLHAIDATPAHRRAMSLHHAGHRAHRRPEKTHVR